MTVFGILSDLCVTRKIFGSKLLLNIQPSNTCMRSSTTFTTYSATFAMISYKPKILLSILQGPPQQSVESNLA